LTEVKELPVKTRTIPGEQYSATQPFSVGMPQIGAEKLMSPTCGALRRLIS